MNKNAFSFFQNGIFRKLFVFGRLKNAHVSCFLNPSLLPILYFACVPFVFPLNFQFFSVFIHQPLFGKHFWVVSSVFFAFSFVNVSYLFETNFPNIPFLKTNLLDVLFLIWFSCSMFLFLCFMLALFLVCFSFVIFVFVLFFFVLLSDDEKHCFPCNLVFFESFCLKR